MTFYPYIKGGGGIVLAMLKGGHKKSLPSLRYNYSRLKRSKPVLVQDFISPNLLSP